MGKGWMGKGWMGKGWMGKGWMGKGWVIFFIEPLITKQLYNFLFQNFWLGLLFFYYSF